MSRPPILTYERACEVLVYDTETGALNWRVGRPGAPKGALVGTRSSHGYTQVEVDYRLYKAHRVIWLMMTGKWPTHQVDHINGMRADNSLNKLSRTFTTQMEALKRYRSKGGNQRIVVERVNVSEGGQAIVGNVDRGVA